MNMQHHSTLGRVCARIVMTLAASTCVALLGQPLASPVAGPTQGFAFDAPTKSLRQVAGSFGAASLGRVVARELEFASVAPQNTNGIACAGGQCFLLSSLESTELNQTALPDPAAMATGAAWSSNGGTVALYSSIEEWVRVVRGLPDNADTRPQWSTRSLGPLRSVAVSENHIVLAIAGDHAGVYELTETGNFVPVLRGVNPAAMAFAADGDTLLVADAAAHAISQVSLTTGLMQIWAIDAVQDPSGIQFGRNESGLPVVYIADRTGKALFAYDASSHALAGAVELAFSPTQLEPIGNGSLQLTSRMNEEDVVWSYTPGRGVYFVPVTPAPFARDVTSAGPARRGVRR